MKKPAVFLDRDGTINEQMGYINHITRFVLLPGVDEAIRLLNDHGFLAIVISNQSGVARGYFPIELVREMHTHMVQSLRSKGGEIDGIFFCPHHRGGSVQEYGIECDCRKPKTGLVEQARRTFQIDMSHSYVIGDRHSDVDLAYGCGLKGILVKTGYGLGDLDHIIPHKKHKPHYVADDLLSAVKWILKQERNMG